MVSLGAWGRANTASIAALEGHHVLVIAVLLIVNTYNNLQITKTGLRVQDTTYFV